MDDLDALLADLQNTVSPDSNHIVCSTSSITPGYGSLNGTRSHTRATPTPYHVSDNSTPSPAQSYSPTYQNHETIEVSTMVSDGMNSYNHGSSGGKMPSLNNNLSELDNLLQDLSNARYNSQCQDRDLNATNGGTTSPVLRSVSSLSGNRSTVDTLLEELSTGVPNGRNYPSSDARTKVTIKETSTVIHPEQLDQCYPHQGNFEQHQNQMGIHPRCLAQNGHTTASNATKELDDLMASLSEFKINSSSHQRQTVTDSSAAYAKPSKAVKSQRVQINDQLYEVSSSSPTNQFFQHSQHHLQQEQQQQKTTTTTINVKHTRQQNQLDSMLGNLQADMSRQGVNITQKGCCSACEKPIVGQVITALGKTWHPEHFTCAHCNQELGTRNFYEREGKPYCEPDYHNLFSPRCAYCNGPILDKCVTALEKTWHTEHFFCAQCGKQFGEDGFHEREGKPYCKEDYFDMFAPKCGGCNRAIMENYISALNSQWHPDCFVCRDCRQRFQGGSFFDFEGQPYCETHYHAKRGSLCAGCHKPITGRCITAMFRKFHPEHFVCAFCLKQLNKGTFKEQNDKPYCHGCFEKLFG